MEQHGHECVGFCEIDKFARESYKAIHNTEGEEEWHDITKVSDEHIRSLRGRVDVICGGFPCQAFSVAGKRGGFDDARGTLFFEIARIANILKPRYLFLENVKGLLNHNSGATFEVILRTLDELGYDAEWQVLNSKNFGVPQNRERVFIVGYLRNGSTRKVFPVRRNDEQINGVQGQSTNTITARYEAGGSGSYVIEGKQHAQKEVRAVLTPEREEKRQNGRRFKEDGEPMFTLTSQDRHGIAIKEATKQGYKDAYPGDSVNLSLPNSETRRGRVGERIANTLDTGCQQGTVTEELKIRKLTPKECFRLQGFPDSAFAKAAEVNSNSQLYKQAGNSVTVNVISAIAERI
ncbi:DNA (cytosine-5-)-methyltransferase [Virgibacillus siamensis]|uniref:DNA (cytosine-5-)-methyltransferase n=1 Tax=Virgibacillus siamensis TaxID=480071 RepID=UPI001589953D